MVRHSTFKFQLSLGHGRKLKLIRDEAAEGGLILTPKTDSNHVDESLFIRGNGASGRTRTTDHLVRSQVLYPAELRTHT